MDRCDGTLVNHGVRIASIDGHLSFELWDRSSAWSHLSVRSDELRILPGSGRIVPVLPSRSMMGVAFGSSQLMFSHCYLIVLFVALATFPWFHWHFKLRTLLILFTLFALALGTIAWLAHR